MIEFLRRKRYRAQAGFTLIELLVVIAIIGMLSSVVLASLNTARAKARDARRLSDMSQVRTALELYYSDNNNRYPPEGVGTYFVRDIATALAPSYIAQTPSDPLYAGQTNDYMYHLNPSTQTYILMVRLEKNTTWCRFEDNTGGGWSAWSTAYPLCNQ